MSDSGYRFTYPHHRTGGSLTRMLNRFTLFFCLMLAVPMELLHAQGYPSPADWRDENIYFIFTDRFFDGNPGNNNSNPQSPYNAGNSRRIHGGDFEGIRKKLDYIKSLGATAVWITPVPQNVGHSAYHGYGADDFYQLALQLGTTNELTNLVGTAHSKGIRIILDVVANHAGDRIYSTQSGWSAYNSAGYALSWRTATQYPAPFNLLTNFHNNGHIGNYSDPEQVLGELSGLDDLRTETTHVRTNMAKIYKHWIQVADFDGFRIDTVKHVDIGFWQYFNEEIRQFAATLGKTNFFQFGEVFDGGDAKCGYYTGTKAGGAFANDSVIDYPLFFQVEGVFADATAPTSYIESRYNNMGSNYDPAARDRLVTFLDNHDQIRFMNTGKANGNTNKLMTALTFMYTSRGVPCLYYGTEQNFSGSGDPNNREDMFDGAFESGPSLGDNFSMTQGSYLHVAKLNNLRRLYTSLRRGTHENLWNNPSGPGLLAYARRLDAEEAYVVLNTASSTQTITNRPTSYPPGVKLVNLLNTNETITTVIGTDGLPPVSVPGLSAKIFIAESYVQPLDPVVIQQFPTHASTNITTLSTITLRFSKPMNTNSVQAAFSVQPPIGGTFTWSNNFEWMTFTPTVPGYASRTQVVYRVGTGAVDSVNGKAFHAPFESYFHSVSSGLSDVVSPTLLVSAPAPGTTITNSFVFSGTAADNVSVQRVEFSIDGSDWFTATGTTSWAYGLQSQNLLNGSHTLSARAQDSAGNFSAVSSVVVRVFNIPGDYVQRISGGNPSNATNCDSTVWLSDRPYGPTSFGYIGGTNGYIANTITGICAVAQPIYHRERYSTPSGTFRYFFDCPAGIYETTILETETWQTGPNQRVFDLYIQGQRMLTNFDIFAASGGMNNPIILTFTNTVSDSQLELNFIPFVENARVSGIQVKRVGEVDSDSDGIPDWWVLGWFDHATGQEADLSRDDDDADGDGFTNLEEFIGLTDPTDPDSHLAFDDVADISGPSFFWRASPGRIYNVEARDSIDSTNAWIPVSSAITGTGSSVWLTDTNTTDHGAYRIKVRLP